MDDQDSALEPLRLEFSGEIWHWRGPSPHHFVTVPEDAAAAIRHVSRLVTYGWGMIPVTVEIGRSVWQTSLWPKDGRYIVPIRASVRAAERLEQGDEVTVRLALRT